ARQCRTGDGRPDGHHRRRLSDRRRIQCQQLAARHVSVAAKFRLVVNFQEVVHSALTGNSEVAKHQRFAENRMDTPQNAPLTPKGREAMVRRVVEGALSTAATARQFNTTAKTAAKWVKRFRAEGVDGLRDR